MSNTTGLAANDVLDVASSLTRQVELLTTEVSRFLTSIRAA